MSRVKDFTELLSTTNPNRVKRGTWESVENRKIYAKWLGEKLRFDSNEDWYRITHQKMIDFHGSWLLKNYYHSSPSQFVMAMFPEYHLKPYKFHQAPQGYWKSEENRKSYAHDLGVHLGYKNIEDWYQITQQQILDFHGRGLLSHYNGSPTKFVMTVFREYHLKPYKFSSPKGYWENKENQKSYAHDLGAHLGYQKREDWYQLTGQQMIDFHGGGLLSHYNGSPSDFVMTVFREYHLKPYKFAPAPQGYWKSEENKKSYARDLGEHLGYKKSEDWYQITVQQIQDFHGGGLLKKYYNGSPSDFVMTVFREYHLELSKFRKNYSQGQMQWLNYMCVETPDVRHILNHEDGEYRIPNSRYLADGYSVSNNRIYEYDGDFYHGNPKIYNQDDMNRKTKTTFGELYENTLNKKQFCEDSGYNIISIWESEWVRAKLTVIKLQKKWKNRKH
jgi:hypothetical protein